MCSASGTLPTVSVCTCHLGQASPKGAVPSALDSAPSCHMKDPTANAPPSVAQAAQARRSPPRAAGASTLLALPLLLGRQTIGGQSQPYFLKSHMKYLPDHFLLPEDYNGVTSSVTAAPPAPEGDGQPTREY